MKWKKHWPESLLALLIIALEVPGICSISPRHNSGWTKDKKLEARESTRRLWYHGFDSYMKYAFPLDELAPLSCTGRGPDWENPGNYDYNDVSGNFSVTLIDVLDTFVVLDDRQGFERAVRNVIEWVSFDVNTKPQLFEVTIRILGGLLSGHIFASEPKGRFHLPWYRAQLLDLAHDLGRRLLPAFSTPTGIPFARLNLRHGVPKGESIQTCTAGAGSLILEFATLSRLTGDGRFEKAAYKAFFALWNIKSDIGLVGNTINIRTGTWMQPEITGIGAGIDSFYEYALKWYIMSGEVEFLDVFLESYSSIMRYARAKDGFWYRPVNIHTGDVAYYTVDSLSVFWPGLQVLAGDVQNAIKAHQFYWNIWRRHSGLPEVWDGMNKIATSLQYPLRPEFIESTWYLYRATRDPFYLDVGERVLSDITLRTKVECGLTGIKDLRTNSQEDRMESFALSETLKYLFLLFDEENPLHKDDSNFVFSTEGHIMTLPRKYLKPMPSARRKMRKEENHACPAYKPVLVAYDGQYDETGLVQGIRSRPDVDYARELVALLPGEEDQYVWEPHGWCEKPTVDLFSYEFILSANGKQVPEDLNPGPHKLVQVDDGYLVQNVTGIRTHIVSRLEGKGYDITKLGPHSVKRGQTVYINDSALRPSIVAEANGRSTPSRSQIALRFFPTVIEQELVDQSRTSEVNVEDVSIMGFVGLFGASLHSPSENRPLRFAHDAGVRVIRTAADKFGCKAWNKILNGEVLLLQRGQCTFLEKLVRARDAGASGVIVISDEDHGFNPTTNEPELAAAGELRDVAIAVVTKSDGALVTAMMDSIEAKGRGEVRVVIDHERSSNAMDDGKSRNSVKERTARSSDILLLNGHPLLNTRMLV